MNAPETNSHKSPAARIRDREWVEWGFANLTLPEALRRLRAVNADRAARDEEPLGEPPFTGKRDRLDDDPPGDIEGGSSALNRPVIASRARRFVALSRYTGAAIHVGDPGTLEDARREARDMREGASLLGYTDRRVGVYELTEVERV